MNKSQLKQLIKEVLRETTNADEPMYVEYVGEWPDEKPFMLGGEKFQYVKAKYPDGKVDIGVYAFRGDVVYSYKTFQKMYNINEGNSINKTQLKQLIKECIHEISMQTSNWLKNLTLDTLLTPDLEYSGLDTPEGQQYWDELKELDLKIDKIEPLESHHEARTRGYTHYVFLSYKNNKYKIDPPRLGGDRPRFEIAIGVNEDGSKKEVFAS